MPWKMIECKQEVMPWVQYSGSGESQKMRRTSTVLTEAFFEAPPRFLYAPRPGLHVFGVKVRKGKP